MLRSTTLRYIDSFISYFWAKISMTIPVTFFIFNEEQFLILYGLIFILILDTILGIWVSVKYKVFTSHRLGRIATKVSRYTIGLLSAWVLVCVSPTMFGWAFNFFGVFFILTEVFSNFEKLSLLGMKIPTKLLAKLNKNFHEFYFGDIEEKKEAVSKILSKSSDRYHISPKDINFDKNTFDN